MMMHARILARAIAVSLALGLLIAATPMAGAKTTLKALYFLGKPQDMAVWAIKKGIVKSDAVEVEFKTGDISALIQALGARTYDVIETSALAVPRANLRGLPLRVLASGGRVAGGQVVLVKKDSPLKTAADLKGKSLAISSLGSTSVALMRLALWKKYGLNIAEQGGDIVWKEIPLPTIPTAVQRGQLDAGYTLQDASAKSLESGEFRVLMDASVDYESTFKAQYLPSVWVTYETTIKEKTAAMKEFQRMFYESVKYGREHLDEMTADIAKKENISQKLLKTLAAWNVLSGKLTPEEIAAYETFFRISKEAGMLPEYPPINSMMWLGYWEKK
ncbi:MAG: ABC transporter substrate-binding protein [Candidatus Tectomicrobia bacterium]|nr:ABC transporter substrate-binding protein [Candidatus Tectomicrobia bacterium]